VPRTKTLGRPVGANGDQTRERILVVARRQFGDHGYARATLSSISQEVGLTSGAIYYYFRSKQALLTALMEQTTQIGIEGLQAAADRAVTLRGRLRAVLEENMACLEATPELARFRISAWADGGRYPELRQALEASSLEYDSFFRQIVEEAITDGELPPGIDAQHLTDMVRMVTFGMMALAGEFPRERTHGAIEAIEALFEGALFTPDEARAVCASPAS
jgi:AcrR family transcriptional regulator